MTCLGLALALYAAGATALAPAAPSVPVTLTASERLIRVTPTYCGEPVRLQGTAPAGCDVVVKLISQRRNVVCSRKGKVGPFWLAVGRVRFSNAPLMYKVNSSRRLEDVVDADEQVRYGLGRRGLKASIGIPQGPDGDLYLEEFIRVQQGERLYDFEEGTVERDGDGFHTRFFWPPDASPGDYVVEAYAIRDGRVVGSARTVVDVRTVGIEAWVRDLARNHGLLYGMFSVALAAMTGLAASSIFRARSRRAPPAAEAPRR
jgi:uncharacterized protein (TIGR02186 family)